MLRLPTPQQEALWKAKKPIEVGEHVHDFGFKEDETKC
jgi:hypothetical protein